MIDEKRTSKFLSLVLRHNPDIISIVLDQNGWVEVDELIKKLRNKNIFITYSELKQIVETNNKQRFAFNIDGKKIRANQGHSIEVDLEYKEIKPPAILYHGTANKNIDSILLNGINKMKRNHVHLSQDIITARQVGTRHGDPIILEINAEEMDKNGIVFYLSVNNVWLTEFVAVEYIKLYE